MSSFDVVYIAFMVVLVVLVPGSNASCSDIHPDINLTLVATMCTDSVVTGRNVYIDTSQEENMLLTPGTICTCQAELLEGTFSISANYTGEADSQGCGSILHFQTDNSDRNVTCEMNLGSVFQNITNVTIDYHTASESVTDDFCVQLQAAWRAIRDTFPGCVVKGCVFHWNQSVYRKIQQEGLATAYNSRGDKYQFLRKLMSLPYLPSEHIRAAFDQLHQQAEEVGGPVLRVCSYILNTWIEGSVGRPENWSVFRQTVRTNNDVEDTCADDEFQCTDGTCIPGDAWCNFFPDCPDRSDEDNNYCATTCSEGQIHCDDQVTCIVQSQRCDGKVDCLDGSDESIKYCENGTVTNDTSSTPERSFITVTCHKLLQQSTTTLASTTTPARTPAATTDRPSTVSPVTTSPHTGSTPMVTDAPDKSSANIGMIVGIVIGCIVLIVGIGVGIYFRKKLVIVAVTCCRKLWIYEVEKKHKEYMASNGEGGNRIHDAPMTKIQ